MSRNTPCQAVQFQYYFLFQINLEIQILIHLSNVKFNYLQFLKLDFFHLIGKYFLLRLIFIIN
jgi:hypothetical protein